MKTTIKFSAIIILISSLCSCSVYVPNGVNTPMFTKKGETQINASVGTGVNVQGAYAVSDHVGIIANGYFNNTTTTINNDDTRKGNGKLFEGGVGYFTKADNGFAFETYVGAGFGNLTIDKSVVSTKSNKAFETSAAKIFIQPTIGYAAKHFELGFTPRFTMMKYQKPTTTYSSAELAADKFVNIDQTNWLFIEPTLTIRAGGEKLKGQVQLGRSFKLNSQELGYSSGILNLGIVYKFGEK